MSRRPRLRENPSEKQAVAERVLAALRAGTLQELMDVLSPDVVFIAVDGGIAAAGASNVSRMLACPGRALSMVWLNDVAGD